VLRLEPHIVISNRTAVPLQLLQSRLALLAGPAGSAQARPAGAVVAEGGSSFSQTSRGISGLPLAAGVGELPAVAQLPSFRACN
jgi:hypothetical protein